MKSNNIWQALWLMWKTAATRCDVFIDAHASKKGLSIKKNYNFTMNQAFSSGGRIREARKLVHLVDHGRGGRLQTYTTKVSWSYMGLTCSVPQM